MLFSPRTNWRIGPIVLMLPAAPATVAVFNLKKVGQAHGKFGADGIGNVGHFVAYHSYVAESWSTRSRCFTRNCSARS